MKLREPVRIQEIANLFNLKLKGDPDALLYGINEIHKVEEGDLLFVDHPKYYDKALNSKGSFVIINKDVPAPVGKTLLLSETPFSVYNRLVAHFYPVDSAFTEGKTVGTKVRIGQYSRIYPGVVIGNNVEIGDNCTIYPNVVIYDNTRIGDNVIIHANSTIGGQAYYYHKGKDGYTKWHSCGEVVIEDNVEIGSQCTIDKGVSGRTRIGKGTKLDNQVHIGHGVEIGMNCLLAAQCGVGGKTIIEDDVICWGQVGITKSVRIGRGAVLGAQAGVSKSLEGGKVYFGSPAREIRAVHKEMAALRSLPDFIRKFMSK